MRPIPADSLGHAHGLLRAIEKRGRLRTDEFVTEFSLEELFPPDLENALGRLRHFISYARAAGLVKEDRGVVELTDLGRRYIRSGDDALPFDIAPAQAEWLRRQLREKHMTDSIFHGLAIGLSLLASCPPGTRVSTMDFGRSMAYLGRAGWDNENTFEIQGERHLILLTELELIDGEHALTPTGEQVRSELTLPVHMSLTDIAAQLNPGGADAVRADAEREWAQAQAETPPAEQAPPAAEPEAEEDNGYHDVAPGAWAPADDEPSRPPIVPRAQVGDPPANLSSGDPLAAAAEASAPPPATAASVGPPGAAASSDAVAPPAEASPAEPVEASAPPPAEAGEASVAPPPDDAAAQAPVADESTMPWEREAPVPETAPVEEPAPEPAPPADDAPSVPPPVEAPAPEPVAEAPSVPPPVEVPAPEPAPPVADAPSVPPPVVVAPPVEAPAPEPAPPVATREPAPAFVEAAGIQAAGEAAGLSLPMAVYANAAAALAGGRHLLLTGAPGSGKTTLALAIARAAAQAGKAHGATVVTAEAGWSAADLVVEAAGRGRWVIVDELDQAEPETAFRGLSSFLAGVPVVRSDGEEAAPADGWRIVATWGGGPPQAGYMRRFAVVEVAGPPADALHTAIEDAANGDTTAARAVQRLRPLGEIAPLGAGVFLAAARHAAARNATTPGDETTLAREVFAAYFAPLLGDLDHDGKGRVRKLLA